MKRVRIFLSILSFFTVFFLFSYMLFVSHSSAFSRLPGFRDYIKNNFGGKITNRTTHAIKITEWRSLKILPAGQSSRQTGVFDADAIVIEKPSKFEENIYNNGVIKICDFADITITSEGNTDYIKSTGLTPICKFAEDYGYFPDINSAFPFNPYSVKHQ